jgi:hypothetical protein
MAIIREDIYQALFARIQSKVGAAAKTYLREYREADEVEPLAQPAVLVLATHQEPENSPGRPTKWTLHATVFVYAYRTTSSADATPPETVLHNIVDAVESALEFNYASAAERAGLADPADHFVTTLGGKVERAWIGGAVEMYAGPAENGVQMIAVVPIEMLATA